MVTLLCKIKHLPLVITNTRKMVRVLHVAEKNDAAKSLAGLLSRGGSRRREGFSKFNKLYDFDYHLFGQNCSMTMTSVSGHLLQLEFLPPYNKWLACNPVQLFEAPVQKHCPERYTDIKRTLEREIRGCQYLVIWTDCDREGENIGYEIIQVCRNVKNNLRIFRARFSEITPAAVQRALANLQEPDEKTSNAVDVRTELDLRIGASFTRFQTLRLKKVFPAVLAEQLISYGSCQFPTLGFVVERYKQVQAFIPEPFWKISVSLETEDGVTEFNWKRQRLFDHLACLVLYQHCLDEPEAKVTDVKSKPKTKWRPNALDTVELEKLASRKLKINAKETMQIAEKLYTQGLISYPRTETNIFPKELDLASLVQQQIDDPNWGSFAADLFQTGVTPRNGNKTDHAHPPIHPTKYANNLQGNEKRLYEFIVRHFLACCSQDARGQETIVDIEVNKEEFSAQGLMIIARNYLEVYPYDKWTGKILPVFEVGSVFQPKRIEMNQGETSPPSLLTEADLIALMDKHGIGTDATHAEHIEKIKSRMYVGVRPDGKFVPGELGMGLVDGYDAMGFEMSKPNLRAGLERSLKDICDGKRDPENVLTEQIACYRDVFICATEQANKIDSALSEYFGTAQDFRQDEVQMPVLEPVKPCPSCGKQMMLRTKKDGGYFVTCSGFPDCKTAVWFPNFVLSASVEQTDCQRCQPGPVKKIKFKFKRGSIPPYIPEEYVGCIGGCDDTLRELLNIKNTAPVANRPVQPTRGRGRGGNFAGNNNGNYKGLQNGRTFSTNTSVSNNPTGLLPTGGRGTNRPNQPNDTGYPKTNRGGRGGNNYGNIGRNDTRGDGGGKTKRKCGQCRQEGHNKLNCPQNR